MFKQIKPSHPIFSGEYRKSREFFILDCIKNDAPLLLSDGREVVICGTPGLEHPLWIWTSDSVSEYTLSALDEWILRTYPVSDGAYFVAKPSVARRIYSLYSGRARAFEHRVSMMAHVCPELIPARNTSAVIDRPDELDLPAIAGFCEAFSLESLGGQLSPSAASGTALSLLERPLTFVIREDGRPAAMATANKETPEYTCISWVYTAPEARCRGYAAALVAHISRLILESGKTPFLYTDLANPCSNRAYANVGFIPSGRVDEIKLVWQTH